jgi:hypothetical protein
VHKVLKVPQELKVHREDKGLKVLRVLTVRLVMWDQQVDKVLKEASDHKVLKEPKELKVDKGLKELKEDKVLKDLKDQ